MHAGEQPPLDELALPYSEYTAEDLAQRLLYVSMTRPREMLVLAIGCGSLFLSHLNDGGFWIVKESLGLTVGQTLRTWTVTETLIGLTGLVLVLAVNALLHLSS